MIVRTWEWLRRHQELVDFLWMLPLLALSLAVLLRFMPSPAHVMVPAIHLGLTLVLCLPLTFRRSRPRSVFAIIAVAAFVQWLLIQELIPADVAVLVAMYTVAVGSTFRWALAAGLVTEFGALLVGFWPSRDTHGDSAASSSTIFYGRVGVLTVCVAAIWLCGRYVNTRRKYLHGLEERAARLERERDAHVQIATAAERARIAREMHDVIAHSISVIVVQADGATYALDSDPARAKRAMEAIGSTGRQALTEMRRMLGVLRDGDDATSYAPQPGIEQLTELVDQIRSAGLMINLTVRGVPSELPAGLQLAVYRIVQEALTNTRKHGGPNATANVRLHYGDEVIEVRVSDDGRGAAAADDGRGHGLLSMRERVAAYGGSVRAGPRPGGGYEVVARLSVPEPTMRAAEK